MHVTSYSRLLLLVSLGTLCIPLIHGQDNLFCLDQLSCCTGLNDSVSLADWNNCSIYYLCFAGSSYVYTCSIEDRPNYNPETRQCVASVDGCVGGTRVPDVTPSTPGYSTVITTTVIPSTNPDDISTTTTGRPIGNCTEAGSYYIPYPGDCSKYMICSNFILLPDVRECPPGTRFDEQIRECNLESLVECRPTCPEFETVVSLPHDKNCSLYWLCSFGNATLRQCPAGLVFDAKLRTCNLENNVLCPNLCPQNATINLPHSRNCSLYWLCTFGDSTLKQCPPDLLFDPSLRQCNLASEVDCNVNLNWQMSVIKYLPVDNYSEELDFEEENSAESEEYSAEKFD